MPVPGRKMVPKESQNAPYEVNAGEIVRASQLR
jgi:hypothetical protein